MRGREREGRRGEEGERERKEGREVWRPASACAGEVGRDLAVGGGSIRSWIGSCEEAGARARCTGGCTPPPSRRVQRRPREELEPQRWSTAPASAGGAWAAVCPLFICLQRCSDGSCDVRAVNQQG